MLIQPQVDDRPTYAEHRGNQYSIVRDKTDVELTEMLAFQERFVKRLGITHKSYGAERQRLNVTRREVERRAKAAVQQTSAE